MAGVFAQLVGVLLLVAGTMACALGAWGVLRCSDTYLRIQAAGMVITAGAGGVLLSIPFLAPLEAGLKAVATAVFLLLTAPLVTHVLARTAYRRRVPLAPETVRDDLAAREERRRSPGRGVGP